MNAIQWTVSQSRRLDLPCGAATLDRPIKRERRPDAVERNADWVSSLGRRVTWVEVCAHLACHRYYAMRLLREGSERGLLRRVPSKNPKRPDLFEGAR